MENNDDHQNSRAYKSENGKFIYHICIIDYLQPYTVLRRFENFTKRTFTKAKASEISAVAPGLYASRFQRFMKNHVFKSQEFIVGDVRNYLETVIWRDNSVNSADFENVEARNMSEVEVLV